MLALPGIANIGQMPEQLSTSAAGSMASSPASPLSGKA